MTVDPEVVEADLAAGRLCCPGCDGPLVRWGFAREREVRMLDGVRLGQAAAGVLPRVRDHARAAAGVLGAASARWRGGDRPRCWPRPRATGTGGSPPGSGARRGRCAAGCARSPAGPRRSAARRGSGRTRSTRRTRAPAGRIAAGRGGRRARDRSQGVPAAPRDPRLAVGAGGRADRGCCTAARATRPGSSSPRRSCGPRPARPRCHPAEPGGSGSSAGRGVCARTTPADRRLTPADGSATPCSRKRPTPTGTLNV